MIATTRKSQGKRRHVPRKIKVEGEVDRLREITVRYKTCTVKWGGLESCIEMWTKIYERP